MDDEEAQKFKGEEGQRDKDDGEAISDQPSALSWMEGAEAEDMEPACGSWPGMGPMAVDADAFTSGGRWMMEFLTMIVQDEAGAFSCLATLLAVLFGIASMRGEGRIDTDVKNRITGWDGHGRYRVRAKSVWQIHGAHVGAKDNLPAHIIQIGKNEYVVDRSKTVTRREDAERIQFQPVEGNWHIQPRGQDRPVSDMMAGFEHEYVQRDDEAAG